MIVYTCIVPQITGQELCLAASWRLFKIMGSPVAFTQIEVRSVHNSRIERLWRDVFEGCTIMYYNLLEETSSLHLM